MRLFRSGFGPGRGEKQRLIRNHPILIEAGRQYAAALGAEDDRGA